MPPERKFFVLENRILDADAIADAYYLPADEQREFSELRIVFKAGYQEIGMTLLRRVGQ